MSFYVWGAVAASVVYLAVQTAGATGAVRGLKVLPALLLAAGLAATHPLAAAGFVLCAAGDAFLLDKERFLLHGLASFLLGHLLLVPAFLAASGALPSPLYAGALLVVAGGVLSVVRPRKTVLRVAVPVYALVLCAMVAAASTLGTLGLVGGLSFLASDAMLSIRLFKGGFRGNETLVMITYYGALVALAAALG